MSTSSPLSQLWPESASLTNVLKAGAVLAGADPTDKITGLKGLPEILQARLERFDELLIRNAQPRNLELHTLELNTALASLYVIERVHHVLSEPAEGAPPNIGTKDMGQLLTHLSILYRWGTDLLLSRILPTLPNKRSPRLPPNAQIIDLTVVCEDYTLLSNIMDRLLKILFPEGPQGRLSQTFIAKSILNRGFTDVLRPFIFLGWLPNDLRGDLPPATEVKPYMARLLNCLPPSQTIASLGAVLSTSITFPQYVHRMCSQLLCGQLLRPYGVAGLFSALFGEDVSSTDAPLEKLDRVSRVLNVVPGGMTPESYYGLIIPRLIHLLAPSMAKLVPPAHKRAAAFSLSRMLIGRGGRTQHRICCLVVAWLLNDPFRPPTVATTDPPPGLTADESQAYAYARTALPLAPSDAVPTLSALLTNTDPAPAFVSGLLQPIVPHLYGLLEYLRASGTADPTLREEVEGLLSTWAMASEKSEVVDTLWEVIDKGGGDWAVDDAGKLRAVKRSPVPLSLTLSQLAALQEGKLDNDEDPEANPLGLRPHPYYFAKFLKAINREDVSSALYLAVLDAHVKLSDEDEPLRKLLLFKLIMQISSQVGETASEKSALKRPDVTRILMFIKLSLEQDGALLDKSSPSKLSLDSLRLVPEQIDSGADDGEDSDDEDLAPGLEGIDKSEHLSVTAVNLLLALLEEHSDLSPRTEPLLNTIYSQLELLANSASDALRPRAREARLTLTARLASSSLSASTKDKEHREDGQESPQEKYQRALKLLQDPILPVRAHGLLLLRELVAPQREESISKKQKKARQREGSDAGSRPSSAGSGSGASSPASFGSPSATISTIQGAAPRPPAIAPALAPAILAIFLQAAQDEDSYVFLNAVQGLAAMVDGFGKEVLRGLVGEYAKGLGGSSGSVLGGQEVDVRVRVGEALAQVVRRCGGALGGYVDIIVPSLLPIVRGVHLPTALRTSAISILATAADTNSLALNAYTSDLVSSMIDLTQLETVAAVANPRASKGVKESGSEPTDDVRDRDTDHNAGANGNQGNQSARTNQSPNSEIKGKGRGGDDVAGDGNRSDTRPETPNEATANPKSPPLRRAALHFLALLVRALVARVYDAQGTGDPFGALAVDVPGALLKRGVTVLGYVAATDVDEVVRVMAREGAELLDQLRKALVGM